MAEFKGYSWSCGDVLSLLGVHFNPGKEENIISCPFCGGKRFAMNIRMGTGRCFNCTTTADSASYYAADQGMSLNDARNDIKRRLSIPDERGQAKERFVYQAAPQEAEAPDEQKNLVYRAFLDELKLTDEHRSHLVSRGFTDDDIASRGYKSFPTYYKKEQKKALCRRLQGKGLTLKGIPGFYKDTDGTWTFVWCKSGIIVPQVNVRNLIIGFQIRKDDEVLEYIDGELEKKYCWFSSKDRPAGCGAHTSVHIVTDFVWNAEAKSYEPVLHGDRVTLTEGGMKADLCACLLDGKGSLVAVQGVHALGPLKDALLELKKFGLKTVNLAYDMDYLTNPNVKDSLNKTWKLIKSLGLTPNNMMNWEYEKTDETGNKFYLKGLDDYFAYMQKGIVPKVKKREESTNE